MAIIDERYPDDRIDDTLPIIAYPGKEIKRRLVVDDPERNRMLCHDCAKCCMHINHEVDAPENDEDCDYIIWFLLHENVSIWIDDDNVWFVEFRTPCKALKDGLCSIYEKRPQVCREYLQDSCLNTDLDDDIIFNTPEEFLDYMKRERKYNYNGFYKDNIKSIFVQRVKTVLSWFSGALFTAACVWYETLVFGFSTQVALLVLSLLGGAILLAIIFQRRTTSRKG
ncbi:conserved hypothetical protein [Gammaproteobacteria bacterium]